MRLLFATSISFPSKLANRQQAMAMAAEYGKILGEDFLLAGVSITPPAYTDLPAGKSGASAGRPEDLNIRVENISGWSKSFVLAARELRLARRECITHILCREGRLFLFLILFRPFLHRRAKIIFEEHSFPKRISLVYRYALRRAEAIIATTSIIKNALAEIVPAEKVHIAPHGVDAAQFDIRITKEDARQKLNLPKEKTIWGYTGTFKTFGVDKGISDILKALAITVQKNPDTLFVAVGGNDEDRTFYEREARELGVHNHTQFIGYVGKNTLAEYQKASDILLMPFPYTEYYAYYMLPLKTFEYMASNRPIIASNLPSIREVLNEENAVLVPPDSPEHIAEAAHKLAGNHALAEKLAGQARKDVERYSWKNRAQSIITFIQHNGR